jgi:hypothetical protein
MFRRSRRNCSRSQELVDEEQRWYCHHEAVADQLYGRNIKMQFEHVGLATSAKTRNDDAVCGKSRAK